MLDFDDTTEQAGKPATSTLAIVSFVAAFLCQPVGLVIGVIALIRIIRSQGRLGGLPFAISGVVVSCFLALFCLPMMAAIAIPALLVSRSKANEASALLSIQSISVAQESFKTFGCIDQDKDGEGEYAFLAELGGQAPCRVGGNSFGADPFIEKALGTIDNGGVAVKAGYCFKMVLPDGRGGAYEESANALPAPDPKAADAQESGFLLYAWPETERSGRRLFVLTPGKQVYVCSPSPNIGRTAPPPWDLAFEDTDGDGDRDFDDLIDQRRFEPVQ